MSGLDFDGEYGQQYRQRIRLSIPAYDKLEIGAAALAAKTPVAREVLVVGPGAGEELPGLLQAMPLARFTLLEPSEQMAEFCRSGLPALHAGSRCLLHQQSLADSGLEPAGFDAVVSPRTAPVATRAAAAGTGSPAGPARGWRLLCC